jgi:hypothetical protein
MTQFDAKRLTDPRELRAIAHPLRNRLLTELFARQAATATVLSQAVGEPVNKVSFHLRLLAKYGFIVEVPELARDGRDRWWRPAHADGIDWDYLAEIHAPVVRSQLNEGLNRSLKEVWRYFSAANQRLPAWEPGSFSHDWYLHMTPEEAADFDRQYLELCFRWRDRVAEKLSAGETEGRQSYAIFIYGFPMQQPDGPS